MPELPDITVYCEAIARRTVGKPISRVRILNPFFLRTFDPSISEVEGQVVTAVKRLGKRVCLGTANDLWLVIHLMIAGRFQWKPPNGKFNSSYFLASFDFEHGSLVVTEAGSKRLASLHVVRGVLGLLVGHGKRWFCVLANDDFDSPIHYEPFNTSHLVPSSYALV